MVIQDQSRVPMHYFLKCELLNKNLVLQKLKDGIFEVLQCIKMICVQMHVMYIFDLMDTCIC